MHKVYMLKFTMFQQSNRHHVACDKVSITLSYKYLFVKVQKRWIKIELVWALWNTCFHSRTQIHVIDTVPIVELRVYDVRNNISNL